MSDEIQSRIQFQSRGASAGAEVNNSFLPSRNTSFRDYQHCYFGKSSTVPVNNVQLPVGFSREVLPINKNSTHSRQLGWKPDEVVSSYEHNHKFLSWNDSSLQGSSTQLLNPSINSYCHSYSVPSKTPNVSPSMVSIKQKHQLDEIRPTSLLVSSNDNSSVATAESYECPVCGRHFVYQLNFVKHLAAAACCQPPCKKSRKQEPESQDDAFKSNTLPRPSRSKKVTRSNSTKLSRKTKKTVSSQLNDVVVPEFVPPTTETATTGEHAASNIHNYQGNINAASTLDIQPSTSEQMLLATATGEFCDFCQLQFSPGIVSQRHRLAHALVIQLTRSLELSVIDSSTRETDSAVLSCLTDQVRVNFKDCNWLRQAVKEVEQVLDCSNVDVDIRQRHGIQDDTEFQNIVEFLMTQDPDCLHQNPQSTPEVISLCEDPASETSLASYSPFPTDSSEHLSGSSPFSSVPSDLASLASSPDNYHPSSLDVSRSEDSFNSFGVDIHQVERQMAGLLFETCEFPCPECGQCFSQSESMFQHMSVDHPLNMGLLRHEALDNSSGLGDKVLPDLETGVLSVYPFDNQ